MVVRAIFKLGEHAVHDAATGAIDNWLMFVAVSAAVQNVLRINFLITCACLPSALC